MEFKKFRFIVLSAIIVILVLAFAVAYFVLQSPYWMLSIWFGALIILVVILLIRYVENWKIKLTNFLMAISHDDFSSKFSDNQKDGLDKAFSIIIAVFNKLRSEKEINHVFLKMIVEHVNTALLCFDKDKNIVIINDAAKQFFGRQYIINLGVVERFDKSLAFIIDKIKGGQKKLYKFNRAGIIYNVSIHATCFKLKDVPYKLVSLQDVKFELEEQEIDSWKKLVRVLTHEIMNTAIPISTLASVINQMLVNESGEVKKLHDLTLEEEDDLKASLKTIEKRSKGMVDFVRVTKSYTNIAHPQIKNVDICDLISRVIDLHQPELEEKRIKVNWTKKIAPIYLNLDAKLIEQVLINLLRNSIEAVEKIDDPKINLRLETNNRGQTFIHIIDNGCGMNMETLENIFVPFFTTKRNGSGIGLSLSRQIMKMHHGIIEVNSIEGEGTKVTMCFQK